MGEVGNARRAAAQLLQNHAFDDIDAGNVAIVVNELATNLAKHAGGGLMSFSVVCAGDDRELEIVCIDSGPGIKDVARCLEDGYSTTGTPGSGLGAIQRISRKFDLFSQSGEGTVQLVRLGRRNARPVSRPRIHLGGISVPVAGEVECGDAWTSVPHGHGRRILVADGLGHGPIAAEASGAAVRVLHETQDLPLLAAVDAMHTALRVTRGAAVAIAEIDPNENLLRYSGVGNISAHIASPELARVQNLVSINGTLGCLTPRPKEFTYPFTPGSRLVMYSDGLQSQLRADGYPGLSAHDPSVVAAVLYRDFARGRDDATVVVADMD
jgi:anti-sigma regulatory factor (Ser/Thr protein kinase)